MNRKYLTFLLTIAAIAAVFLVALRVSKNNSSITEQPPKQLTSVTVQSVSASKSLLQQIEYPGTIVGEQEVKVTAKSAGTAKTVNFDLGDKVSANATLIKIDDTGNILEVGDDGFRSADVQQAQLSVEEAEEQLELYEKTYKKLWNAYQTQKKNPDLTKTVTKAQLIAAKGQIEIAEVQLESARVGHEGGLDDHLITSPIGGYITSKSIAVGDSIALGQQLYTISKTSDMKIQFFVDQEQLASLTEGIDIKFTLNNGESFPATVKNISPVADENTKRFLIEALPAQPRTSADTVLGKQDVAKLTSGTIVTVSFSVTTAPRGEGNLILPLAAITVGQNENYIFVAEENIAPNQADTGTGQAKKVTVQIIKIDGERAEIKTDLPTNAMIIVSGNKLVSDGEEIKINN